MKKNKNANQFDLALPQPEKTDGPKRDDQTVYNVGISGGKDSGAALLWAVYESGLNREQIKASWCDIENDHDDTRAHVKWLSENVHPIETLHPEMGFFDLAFSRKRFPSQGARFCTEELKIIPTSDYIQRLKFGGKKVIAISGVRADESEERKNLTEWDFSGNYLCWNWRPLITWTIADVYALHAKHGVPLNPLYAKGAKRVGCWPCFMCQKEEVRNIALNDPKQINKIRNWENRFEKEQGRYSSFFTPDKVPMRFRSKKHRMPDGSVVMIATIDDVVKWSMTGKNAKGAYTDADAPKPTSCNSGMCE